MSNIRKHKLKKSGFTLIELLVVIAIIAILASILFPVFARARDNARRASGVSNVKQIVLGILQYQQDYDGRYFQTVTEAQAHDVPGTTVTINPTAGSAASAGNQPDFTLYSYKEKLQPYVKSEQLFKDPSAPAWNTDLTVTTGAGLWSGWYPTDYGFNLNEGALSGTDRQQAWFNDSAHPVNATIGVNQTHNQSSVQNSSRFILIGEAARGDGTPSRGGLYPFYDTSDATKFYAFPGGPSGGTVLNQARAYKRHFDGTIFGYADGHAKWKHPEDTWVDPSSDANNGANNEWSRNVQ